jgi:hypothetical protein
MQQSVYPATLIRQITKDPYIRRTGGNTGSFLGAFGEKSIIAEIAFIHETSFLFEVPGIIRTSSHAGFASDTTSWIHHDNPGSFILPGCGSGTDTHTWRTVAMITEYGHKDGFIPASGDGAASLENVGSVSIRGNIVGGIACFYAEFAVNAAMFPDNHGIMW